jgi:hypothetical protein
MSQEISPAMKAFHLAMAEAMRRRTDASGPLCRHYTLTVRDAQAAYEAAGQTPEARRAFESRKRRANELFDRQLAPIEAEYRATLAAEQAKAWANMPTSGTLDEIAGRALELPQ